MKMTGNAKSVERNSSQSLNSRLMRRCVIRERRTRRSWEYEKNKMLQMASRRPDI